MTMAMPAKHLIGVVIVGVCAWGGYHEWQSRHAPAAAVANPAAAPVEQNTTTQVEAVHNSPPVSSPPPVQLPPAYNEATEIGALQEAGKLEEALARANALVAAYEPHARTHSGDLGLAYLTRGELLDHLKRYDEALADFERIYFLWRDQTDDSGRGWVHAYEALTRGYTRAERWTEVIAMSERGITAVIKTPQAHPNWGFWIFRRRIEALLALKRNEDAAATAKIFRQWFQSLPTSPEAKNVQVEGLRFLATTYSRLNLTVEYTAVSEELRQALSANTNIAILTPTAFTDAVAALQASASAGHRDEAKRQAAALRARLDELGNLDDRANAATQLAKLYGNLDDDRTSLILAQQTEMWHRTAGHTDAATVLADMKRVHSYLDDIENSAERVILDRRIIDKEESLHGQDSIEYLNAKRSLANDLFRTGQHTEAIKLLRELTARAERLKTERPDLLESCLTELGFILVQSSPGSGTEASAVLRRGIDLNEKRLGPLAPSSVDPRVNLATALMSLNELEEAWQSLDSAFAILAANQALDSDSAGWAYFTQANLCERQQRWTAALAASRQAVAIRQKTAGPESSRTRNMLRQFVRIAWSADERAAAIEAGENLLKTNRSLDGWTNFRDVKLCAQLAAWHTELGHSERADQLSTTFRQAVADYYGQKK